MWPGIDKETEAKVNTCNACQVHHTIPNKAPIYPLENTMLPCIKIHIDFAAPFFGKRFLIVYASFSKWVEIIPIGNKKLSAPIARSREIFVSDNGPSLFSQKFKNFLKLNGIKDLTIFLSTTPPPTTPPFLPSIF